MRVPPLPRWGPVLVLLLAASTLRAGGREPLEGRWTDAEGRPVASALRTGWGPGWRAYTLDLAPWAGRTLLLEAGNPFVPGLALAVYDAGGRRVDSVAPFGAGYAFGRRPENAALPRFRLEVPGAGGTARLWLLGDGTNRVTGTVAWTHEALEGRAFWRLGLFSGFMAILLAVLVFGLVFSVLVPTDFALPYLAWIAAGGAYLLAVGGVLFGQVYPHAPGLHAVVPLVLGNLWGAALVLLLQRLYRTQPLYPILNRGFQLTRILLGVFALLAPLRLLAAPRLSALLYAGQELLWGTVAFLVLIAPTAFAVRRRDPESPLLFLALAPLGAGVLMESLENLNLVQWGFRFQALHWAGAVSAVLGTAPILLARIRRRVDEGFRFRGAAARERRAGALRLFRREAAVREELRAALETRLGPLLDRVEAGLVALPAGTGPSAEGRDARASARRRLSDARAELRVLADNRMPTDLTASAFSAALDRAAEPLREAGLDVRVDLRRPRQLDQLDLLYRQAFLRMTQGLLHNVLRHARASRVALGLSAEGGRLTLTVRDDGVGFDGRQEGRGLRIIRQRVEALDGTLAWSRPEGGGTACTITVPIRF